MDNIRIYYDYQSIFRQKFGGVTRYHYELYNELNKYENIDIGINVIGSPNYYFKDILGYSPVQNYHGLKGMCYRANKLVNNYNIYFGKYDIIHPTWYNKYCFFKKNKGKYVVTIHDMIHEKFPGFPQWEIEGKKFWLYNSDKIIAVSNNTKNDILELYPNIPEEKIAVVYHGRNKLIKKNDRLDIKYDYVLYVGSRNAIYKNFESVLYALRKLISKGIGVKLFCAGGGFFTDKEKELIHKLGLEMWVEQKNVSDSQLAHLYANAKCFVYPSKYEGFGFPLLEAFQEHCPVIAYNATSLPEIAGDAALYFKEDDELENKMEMILCDENLCKSLIEKESIRLEKFSWKKTAKKTLEVYKNVLSN